MTYARLRSRDCEQLNVTANDVDIHICNAVDRCVELIGDGVKMYELPIVRKPKQRQAAVLSRSDDIGISLMGEALQNLGPLESRIETVCHLIHWRQDTRRI